jgi:hypothetical protein
MKLLRLSVLASVAIFLSSCASSTPQGRLSANPAMAGSLSPAQREAVLAGKISEGMTRDAVYLALGRPSNVRKGSSSGKETEVWRYTNLQPMPTSTFYMGGGLPVYGVGLGGGYFGPRGGRFMGPAWGMGTDYVPVTSALIRFENGIVVSWERAQ